MWLKSASKVSSDVVLTASYDGTARIWTTTANPVLSLLEVRDGEILDCGIP